MGSLGGARRAGWDDLRCNFLARMDGLKLPGRAFGKEGIILRSGNVSVKLPGLVVLAESPMAARPQVARERGRLPAEARGVDRLKDLLRRADFTRSIQGFRLFQAIDGRGVGIRFRD